MKKNMYTYGGKSFKTQKDVKLFCQLLLKTEHTLNTSDSRVMKDLIVRHPNYNSKTQILDFDTVCFDISKPIKFKVEKNAMFQSKCFFIMQNNKCSDFSYNKCITKSTAESNQRHNVLHTGRTLIRPQIKEYIKKIQLENQSYMCAITNQILPRSMIHVDHDFTQITFLQLVDDWLLTINKTYADIKVLETKNNEYDFSYTFSDEYTESWVNYHREHAKLRAIHKTINLKAKKTYKALSSSPRISNGLPFDETRYQTENFQYLEELDMENQ